MILLGMLISIPLLAVVLSALCRWGMSTRYITVLSAVATLGVSSILLIKVIDSPIHFIGSVSQWIGLDPFGAIVLQLVCFVNLTASIFSIGYIRSYHLREIRRYYLNYNLFVFSMMLVPVLQEPNLVWIAVEFTTLFSVMLVAFNYTHTSLEAAWKYVVITLMGAGIALLGFLFLFSSARLGGVTYYTWEGIRQVAPLMPPLPLKVAFLLILIGLGTKVGFVPMHTWLPDAHSQAPSPVCALLSGIETSAILFVIVKLFPIVRANPGINMGLLPVSFGLLSVGVAALLIIQVRDLKRLFAFSTVEHMGIVLVGFGLMGTLATTGAILQMIVHAFTKSLCFYAAGSLVYIFHSREIESFGELIRTCPFVGSVLLIGALAIAGAPPFVVFFSEFSIIRAALAEGHYIIVCILCVFIVVAFFAIMNHIGKMVFSKINSGDNRATLNKSLPKSCKFAIIMSIIPVIIFGIFPFWIYKIANIAAISMGG